MSRIASGTCFIISCESEACGSAVSSDVSGNFYVVASRKLSLSRDCFKKKCKAFSTKVETRIFRSHHKKIHFFPPPRVFEKTILCEKFVFAQKLLKYLLNNYHFS